MKIVIDIETNSLINPTKVWVVVCRDLVTGERHIFRNILDDIKRQSEFLSFVNDAELVIGHNIVGYDLQVMGRLLGLEIPIEKVLDTFIISKLADYPRQGHSVEDYGLEFGLEKINWHDYSKYSPELEQYCIRDVDITTKIYYKYLKYISLYNNKPMYSNPIMLEHKFQCIVNNLETKGFTLDIDRVNKLLNNVHNKLTSLDEDIMKAFPPRLKLIREVTPKETKYGTISLSSIPKVLRDAIADMSPGAVFSHCEWVDFNPGSPKQVVNILNQARWVPVSKTKGHIETERQLSRLRYSRDRSSVVDTEKKTLYDKLIKLRQFGWKVNEENLSTLPASAPAPARTLSQRILYESRRKTLTEWKGLYNPDDGRVHGTFRGIGAWTHRMAHQKPNMANVPNAVKVSDGLTSLLGKELRSCWIAPEGRLLVGVDAEAIQLRVFAHMINDPVLTDAIVNGDKKKGTDPHSLNKKYFGDYCKTRNAAKHSLYAMFFGGGPGKIAEIMDCRKEEAQEAINRLTEKYPGLKELQEEVFPRDARRGWFVGLDGRRVKIPSETVGGREHLCMSGYLQNGEKVIMAYATVLFEPELHQYDSFLVDLVHDEWQTECPNDLDTCVSVAELECRALVQAGIELNLNCPMAGSYRNDKGDYTFGRNWYQTH